MDEEIKLDHLCRDYIRIKKKDGLINSIKSLFFREKIIVNAVSDFNFEMKKGEFVGLIGPNGSGKTTLVKMLTGIIKPTSGEINVFGYIPTAFNDEYKKDFAVVMGQKSMLWWDLPAIDSFYLNKEIYDISDDNFKRSLSYFTSVFNIEALLKVPVRNLSLGERMKMEIVLSLLHEPKILFLDEPTIGLDLIAQKEIRQLLKQVNKDKGVSIILTSHYLEDIKQLCNRVVVINKGRKVYDGKTETLLGEYSHYKIITITFSENINFETRFSDVNISQEYPDRVTAIVNRNIIEDFLTESMQKYRDKIYDFNVEEEKIENIIEKIYRD